MKLYAVKDTKIGFKPPFIFQNDAVAVREFTNVINLGEGELSKNYQDIELYCLGTFDDKTGVIFPCVEYITKGPDVFKNN